MALVASMAVSILWFSVSWRYGLDLSDEGFYWYGAQRVLVGEIPMLDFMAYDIGRYYWSALIMMALGDSGIWAARFGAFACQCIGVTLAVYLGLLGINKRGTAMLLPAVLMATVLNIWVMPY